MAERSCQTQTQGHSQGSYAKRLSHSCWFRAAGCEVLLIGDVLQPFDVLAVEGLLDLQRGNVATLAVARRSD